MLNNGELHILEIISINDNNTLELKKSYLETAKQELEKHLKVAKQYEDRVKLLEYYVDIQEESQNPLRLLK